MAGIFVCVAFGKTVCFSGKLSQDLEVSWGTYCLVEEEVVHGSDIQTRFSTILVAITPTLTTISDSKMTDELDSIKHR